MLSGPFCSPAESILVDNLWGDRVFDLGAGTGADISILSRHRGKQSSMPSSQIHICAKQAIEKADELQLGVEISEANAESLRYADSQFDTVLASMVFWTIPDVDTALLGGVTSVETRWRVQIL
ncbi:MAG: class I SAM-dependent methyltransferase [Halobacteriales archaeon]|nr:class I SAM-dependent methyltransferase [Halobacteriales archaeon]